jgi:hypothetical protein
MVKPVDRISSTTLCGLAAQKTLSLQSEMVAERAQDIFNADYAHRTFVDFLIANLIISGFSNFVLQTRRGDVSSLSGRTHRCTKPSA